MEETDQLPVDMSGISLQDFEKMCEELFKQKVKVEELSGKLDVEDKILNQMKAKVLAYMEANDKEKYHVKGHGLIYLEDRFTVRVPKTVEDKKKLFKYLDQRGIFFEMASVNSQTLNSYYKTEMEAAIARGEGDFNIPGVGELSHETKLKTRKA